MPDKSAAKKQRVYEIAKELAALGPRAAPAA